MTTREFVNLARSYTGSVERVELSDDFTTIRTGLNGVKLSQLIGNKVILRKPWIGSCTFKDWQLGEAKLDGLELRQVEVLNSKVDDLQTTLGLLVIKSSLRKCRFGHVGSEYAQVTDSLFEDVEISNVSHQGRAQVTRCVFDGVRLGGRFDAGNFIDCTFRDTDMSSMVLAGIAFVNCNGLPRLPSRPDNFLIQSRLLTEVGSELVHRISTASMELYMKKASLYAKLEQPEFIDPSWFEEFPADEAGLIMNWLFERRMVQE